MLTMDNKTYQIVNESKLATIAGGHSTAYNIGKTESRLGMAALNIFSVFK